MKRIKVILPKALIADKETLERVLTNGARMAGEQLRSDFEATVNTWTKRPTFERNDLGVGSVEVITDNKIWAMLDAGTKPHIIVPRRAKALRFAWGGFGSYTAKTKVGWLSSRNSKMSKNSQTVYRKRVKHPGTEARKWIETAANKWGKKFPETMNRALQVELKRRGY